MPQRRTLQYRQLNGDPAEHRSPVTTVTPVENGPLLLRGDLVIAREDATTETLPRASLCRCGQSKNEPFCDNSHLDSGFEAVGTPLADALAHPPLVART
jgi:CDGSH-type Zn-finger protein